MEITAHRYIIIFLLSSFSLFSQSSDWKLIWSDEFTKDGPPDSTYWKHETGCSIRNKEAQYYSKDITNAYCKSGILSIQAKQETVGNCTITSASLITKGKFQFQYGKIEIKAKIPKGRGTWPALWMMADQSKYGTWPKNGEIDLLESVGWDTNRVHFNIHTAKYNHTLNTNKGNNVYVRNLYEVYHIYSLEWYPDVLIFKMDDAETFRFKKESDDPAVWPYDRPFYLLMNLAMGGGWGGMKGIDPSVLPAKFEIDYVRVYQKK